MKDFVKVLYDIQDSKTRVNKRLQFCLSYFACSKNANTQNIEKNIAKLKEIVSNITALQQEARALVEELRKNEENLKRRRLLWNVLNNVIKEEQKALQINIKNYV